MIPLILAASLSLTSTNDYVYTVLTSTNVVIAGVGMGENVDYSMMRFEDIAFLHEAWSERDHVAKQAASGFAPGYTNIYSSTNIASHVIANRHYYLDGLVESLTGSNSPGILLAEDQLKRLYTTDRAETNTSYFVDDHFNFKEPFDPHLGYADLVGRLGYHNIGFKTNFWYRYTNLKRGKLLQSHNIPLHESDWSYVSHYFRDGVTYTWETVDGWVPIDLSGEHKETVMFDKGSQTLLGDRSAYLRLGKFTQDDTGESVEAYDWQYIDIEYPYSYVPAYVNFYHSTNQEFQIVYIALDGHVSCTVTIYPFGGDSRTEEIANHRVLYPLSSSSASVKEDRITFSFDAGTIFHRAEVAVGKVITPKEMREYLSNKIGGPPSEGGYRGHWNSAQVNTSVRIESLIIVLRVKRWHARELENGE